LPCNLLFVLDETTRICRGDDGRRVTAHVCCLLSFLHEKFNWRRVAPPCACLFCRRPHSLSDRGALLRTAFAVSLTYCVSITRREYCTPLCLLLPAVETCFAHLASGGYCVLFSAILSLLRARTTQRWSAHPLLAACWRQLHG
jgi:hypothetical protein